LRTAKVEVLDEAAYPAQLISISEDDEGTLVVGTVVLPEGMFGLVSLFRNEQTRLALKDVLREAKPGPSGAK